MKSVSVVCVKVTDGYEHEGSSWSVRSLRIQEEEEDDGVEALEFFIFIVYRRRHHTKTR